MKTTHKIIFEDARNMQEIKSQSVDLMVTSPPYPMIEMWDKLFSEQNKEIEQALKEKNGSLAFELMHKELDKVWKRVYDFLREGGIACINIGDATRTLNGDFQIYPNHTRILNYCLSLGFDALPSILWVKETNKPNKFMGSGMLPVGAYVTLEHEHILILRKGNKREFKKQEEKLNRQKSAFFYEERNVWFSDKWRDIKGILQKLNDTQLRERSAAYPFELVYRLINMFSTQGDMVLDPFLGTGTTILGAMASGRNSIGIEIEPKFNEIINKSANNIIKIANEYNKKRIENHIEFIKEREKDKGKSKYLNENYKFPVITSQEKNVLIPIIKEIKINNNIFEIDYI